MQRGVARAGAEGEGAGGVKDSREAGFRTPVIVRAHGGGADELELGVG